MRLVGEFAGLRDFGLRVLGVGLGMKAIRDLDFGVYGLGFRGLRFTKEGHS